MEKENKILKLQTEIKCHTHTHRVFCPIFLKIRTDILKFYHTIFLWNVHDLTNNTAVE